MKVRLLFSFLAFMLFAGLNYARAAAAITVSTTSLSEFTITYGTASAASTFTVSGTGLTANLVVTAPAGFQVSTVAGSGYGTSVTLTQSGGTVATTTIYVIVPGTAAQTYYTSGSITCASSGASKTVSVSEVVNRANLTITATSTRVYGTSVSSGSGFTGFTATGLQNGETIGSVTINYYYDYSATTAVGTYGGEMGLSGATGGTFTANNYNITYTGGNVIVTPASLTITATAVSKAYGVALSTTTGSTAFTSTALQNGETIGSVTITYGAGGAGNAAIGTYSGSVTPSAATGGTFNANNYSITYVSATLTVTSATLTITGYVSKVYGTTLTSGSGSTSFISSGLQNGETIGSVTIAYGAAAAATTAVGSYGGQATPSTATGGTFVAANYTIVYQSGSIVVTAKPLTITSAAASNKVYNGTTAAVITGTLSGIIGTDNVTLVGTGTFANANVGTGKAVTANCTLAGSAAGNYTLVQPTGLTANITPAALTITATGPQYDVTESMGTITGATTNFTYTGIATGETVTSVTLTPNKTGTQSYGTAYTVTPSAAVVSSSASNYTITYVAFSGVVGYSYTWTGATSINWNVAGNWTGGVSVPGANDNVTIPATTRLPTVNVTSACGSISVTGSTTITLSAPLTVSGLLSIGGNGYALTIAGASNMTLGGISGIAYQSSLTINSGATVNFAANSTINNTASQRAITNGGIINFGANCTLNLAYANSFNTSGTVNAISTIFNITNSSASLTNSGTFNDNGSTFNLPTSPGYFYNTSGATFTTTAGNPTTFNVSGSNAYISNYGIFTDNGSTFNMAASAGSYILNAAGATFYASKTNQSTYNFSGQGSVITNLGTYVDNGSIYTFTSSNTGITNGSSSVTTNSFVTTGGIFTFSSGNPEFITNYSTFTASGNTAISFQTYAGSLTNSGTFYAGLSNSACVITLGAQSANVSNTGTFYLGSTSIIYPTAISTNITNSGGGSFTLLSDAYGSAAIGPLNSTVGNLSSVNGTYNVQRYFQGSTTYNSITSRWIARDYRIISSPVYNTTYSGNNVSGLNYIVGSTAGQTTAASSLTNAFITGCTGGSTSAGNPSVYLFDQANTPSNAQFTSGNFLGITNITNSTSSGTINVTGTGFSSTTNYSIPVGTGVFFFFRGAATNWSTRTVAPYIAPENVTLTSTGSINTFGITYKDWFTPTSSNLAFTGTGTGTNSAVRGYNMVGNPYPCTIDWCQAYSGTGGIVRSYINPTIYTFDPVNQQYDAFLCTSASGGTANGNGSRYIMSGQGFFVQATSASASLTINETAKAPTQQSTGSLLLMGTPTPQLAGAQVMRLKVSIDSLNFDDMTLVFNSSSSANYNSSEDAAYIRSSAPEGLSSFSADSARLSINSLPLPGKTQRVIRLSLDATYTGTFTLQKTQMDAIPKLYQVWLMDKHNKDSLDMRANSTYVFDVNTADTSTYGNKRFQLVIRQNPALMVHLLNFTAAKATGGSEITWVTENEENYTDFTLQRSIDGGTTWTTLEGLVSSAQGTYTFLDGNPVIGADSYRLQMTDLNNTISYSNVVTLMYANTTNAIAGNISVYPNPAGPTLNLAINQTSTNTISVAGQSALQSDALNPGLTMASATGNASYSIKIVSMTGLIVKSATTTAPTWQQSVSDLLPGTYVIKVMNAKDNSVVGTSTFIKL